MFERLRKNPRKTEHPLTEFQRVIKQLENNELDELQFDSQYGRENLHSKEVQTLAAALPKCSRLVKLVLREHGFGDSGAQTLAEALPHVKLVHLEVNGNDIGENGMRALASAIPKCPTLRYLHFHGNQDISGLLEKEIEDLLSQNRCNGNWMIDAVREDDLNKLKFILSRGGSVWCRQWDYCESNPRIAKWSPFHHTPLHIAAMMDRLAIARFLVEMGAPLNIKNEDGKTPAELAKSPEMIALLEELATPKETFQVWVKQTPTPLEEKKQLSRNSKKFSLFRKSTAPRSSLHVKSASQPPAELINHELHATENGNSNDRRLQTFAGK